METMTATASMPFPREPANYDEVSMQQSMLFSDSLKDLKNLRKQLYSAAEYFELSYTNDDQKHIVVNTLKDYAIKALVNTVDHLGSVTYKVNDLLDEKVDEVSGTELRVSCIEQRLRTCQEYIDREGISQQSLVINTPNYHKRYILPVGETMHGAVRTKSKYQGCSLDDGDEWHQFKNAIRATIRETPPPSILGKGRSPSPSPKLAQQPGNFSFSGNIPKKDLERRTVSPHRFPLLRSGSLSSKPTTPRSSNPSTPNRSRPTTPNPSLGRQPYISEPRKSASMRIRVEKESPKDSGEQYPSKSKRLLKALLSRRKSKKDDMLYTYLDEY
ncbi:protein ABIL2 [Sesamum indicum]|uniref:Protein ABIL2 n=1 Tax=Sesamum indicum TaxID=4182 RepID=A0A6I9SZT0_SESIN|nr:protein ABIL2 [Sesamum indicum]